MKTKILSVIFFTVGILFLFTENYPSFPAALILKTMMIPLLAVIFVINIKLKENFLNKLMFAGLLFSWAGDVLLEIPKEIADLFIPGLICFLLTHLMYLVTFFLTPGKNYIFRKNIWLLLPVLLYGAGILYYLFDSLGEMLIPVFLYTFIIVTMVAGSINRNKKVNPTSFRLVLAGAILFLISDSALAINKFSHPFSSSPVLVMLTYLLAQYLIITGYIRQVRSDLK